MLYLFLVPYIIIFLRFAMNLKKIHVKNKKKLPIRAKRTVLYEKMYFARIFHVTHYFFLIPDTKIQYTKEVSEYL